MNDAAAHEHIAGVLTIAQRENIANEEKTAFNKLVDAVRAAKPQVVRAYPPTEVCIRFIILLSFIIRFDRY